TRRDFRVQVRITERSRLRARLYLDGAAKLSTTRKTFSLPIQASRLRSGRHRITVSATDLAGNRAAPERDLPTLRQAAGTALKRVKPQASVSRTATRSPSPRPSSVRRCASQKSSIWSGGYPPGSTA